MTFEAGIYVIPSNASKAELAEIYAKIQRSDILSVSATTPDGVSGPDALKRYSSVFKLRGDNTSESHQLYKTLNTTIALHDAWVKLDMRNSSALVNKLIDVIPVGNYLPYKDVVLASSDYLRLDMDRSSVIELGGYLEVLFVSLLWRPEDPKLKAWSKLAASHDVNICGPCHIVLSADDIDDHVKSHDHMRIADGGVVYECYPCGVAINDSGYKTTYENLSSHLENLEFRRQIDCGDC